MEALVDDDGGDDALGAVGADPVPDVADDLAGVHEEQALVARAGVVRDVRGQEIDCPVREGAAAQAAGAPTSV
ncbi:hypothetical protein [Streptomyces collinus]|uniref:hypothetical protein n=1 Tax=Streptomyces collinus TaxID=42684 RepID=UPI00130ECA51|nr:hypothetical protein [Streptomyces collinus]